MKFSRKAVYGLVVSVAVLAACGDKTAKSEETPSAAPLIGVDYPRESLDNPFWGAYNGAVTRHATELSIPIETTNSANNSAKLVANVQDLVNRGAKGIVIAPQDTSTMGPLLDLLSTKNIPAVSIDTRPDSGRVAMVVRADNRAYGEKACTFLGDSMKGKGAVVALEGSVSSINGRDRTEGFTECLKRKYPNMRFIGIAADWQASVVTEQLPKVLQENPDIGGIYMEAGGAFLEATMTVLKNANKLFPAPDPRHLFVVSNDGISAELDAIRSGYIDATVSQPALEYAKYGLMYAQQAAQGTTFKTGPTDHQSNIVEVAPGVLEDQLSAPLVTKANVNDKSLWGNAIK